MSYIVCSFTPPAPCCGTAQPNFCKSSGTVDESTANMPARCRTPEMEESPALPFPVLSKARAITLEANSRYIATGLVALAWAMVLRETDLPMPMR